jgi:SAM-dependent methyltransferase
MASSYYYKPIKQTYQEYLLSDISDRERLIVQHDISKPVVMTMFERVLTEYGLLQKLEQAKIQKASVVATNFQRIRILDIGCGEGMFLYDIATLLEERGLSEVVELVGIDIDATAIAIANDFYQELSPAKAHFSFIQCDITQPFQNEQEATPAHTAADNIKSVVAFDNTGYDFIFAFAVVEHLADAQRHIQRIYQHLLKAGGVIYLRSTVFQPQNEDAQDGWVVAHPAIYPFYKQFFGFIQNKNPGIAVAKAQAVWLQELGAEKVLVERTKVSSGGATPEGIAMLHNLIMAMRSSAPILISRGMMTQENYDTTMQTLLEELDVNAEGYNIILDTLAYKPTDSTVQAG